MLRQLGVVLVALLATLAPALAGPVCDACKKPLVGRYYQMQDGRNLCEEDFRRQLPRCAVCGAAMNGRYLVVANGPTVCEACYKKYPKCFVCGVPVRYPRELSDGRILCERDARFAVFDDDRGRIAFLQAQDAVVATLGLRLKHPVTAVKVVDATSLSQAMGRERRQGASDLLGMFRLQTRGDERNYTVFLVTGLPPERLQTVAAHEYAHAWHSENHPRYAGCNDRLREGFAEWVAYKVDQRLGRKAELEHLLSQQKEDYIEGLRRFLEIERQQGVAGVMRAATSRDRL